MEEVKIKKASEDDADDTIVPRFINAATFDLVYS